MQHSQKTLTYSSYYIAQTFDTIVDNEWQNYANALDTKYNIMRIPSYGWFDWWILEKDTQNDISISRNVKLMSL